MAQASVALYFNNRKRPAVDDVSSIRSKIIALDADAVESAKIINKAFESTTERPKIITKLRFDDGVPKVVHPPKEVPKKKEKTEPRKTRASKRNAKEKPPINVDFNQEKIVKFFKKGPLSPRKAINILKSPQKPVLNAFSSIESLSFADRGMKTPTKKTAIEQIIESTAESTENVKKKIVKSSRLAELRESINKIEQLDLQLKSKEQKRDTLRETKTIKEFKTIDVEILR